MSSSINSIAAAMQQLGENNDGTLNGGFLSVTDMRYRIIIDSNSPHQIVPPLVTNKPPIQVCSGTTNDNCNNQFVCKPSSNDICDNRGCLTKPDMDSNLKLSTY